MLHNRDEQYVLNIVIYQCKIYYRDSVLKIYYHDSCTCLITQHDYNILMEIQYRPVTTAHMRVNFHVVAMCICNRGPCEVKAVVRDHD